MKKTILMLLAAAMIMTVSSCGKKNDPPEDEGIQIEVPVGELSEYVDKAENDYKSFELLPIESTDFFMNKTLNLVAMVENHEMSRIDNPIMSVKFTDDFVTMKYPDKDGNETEAVNYVYTVSKPAKTGEGNHYVIVAFGDHEMTEEDKEFNTDCLALIKMKEGIDMGPNQADTYVLMIESQFPEQYKILKVE